MNSRSNKVCVLVGYRPDFEIENKVAKRLADNFASLFLVGDAAYVTPPELETLRELSGEGLVEFIAADERNLSELQDAVLQIRQSVDQIDLLLNFAPSHKVEKHDADNWAIQVWTAGYLGPFYIISQLLDLIEASPAGRIINVATGPMANDVNFSQMRQQVAPAPASGPSAIAFVNADSKPDAAANFALAAFTAELAERMQSVRPTSVEIVFPDLSEDSLASVLSALDKPEADDEFVLAGSQSNRSYLNDYTREELWKISEELITSMLPADKTADDEPELEVFVFDDDTDDFVAADTDEFEEFVFDDDLDELVVTTGTIDSDNDDDDIEEFVFDDESDELVSIGLQEQFYTTPVQNKPNYFEGDADVILSPVVTWKELAGGNFAAHSYNERAKWTPLVLIKEGDVSRPPFFCVHGAGGNVLYFNDMARALNDRLTFYGLQARGVDGHMMPHNSIEEMAASYLGAVRQVQPTGPYYLGGYSGGGTIAYEMAQRLKANGEVVAVLALFDAQHPRYTEDGVVSWRDHLRFLQQEGVQYIVKRFQDRYNRVYTQPRDRQRVARLIAQREIIPLELRDLMMATNLLALMRNYNPQPYDGPAAVFTASEAWGSIAELGTDNGWSALIKELDIFSVPGNHNTVARSPNVDVLVQHLEKVIIDAREKYEH